MHGLYQRPAIILFDGYCNLCNFWAEFLSQRDKTGSLILLPMQSPEARDIIIELKIPPGKTNSVIYVLDWRTSFKSDAIIAAASRMSGFWQILRYLAIVPMPIRDWFYDIVAQFRYSWFGMRDGCAVVKKHRREIHPRHEFQNEQS